MARQFPALFPALADGRLNLTGVVLLAPYLTRENADELLAAAAGKRKAEIEEWLAQRFPRSELLPLVQVLPVAAPEEQLALERVGSHGLGEEQLALERVGSHGLGEGQLALERVGSCTGLSAPARIEAPAPRAKLAPVAQERYALQLTIGKGTYEKLQYAQELLGHQIPSGELAEVLDRALDALIGQLERRKCAATSHPRPRPRRSSAHPRYIPAEVKRAVWQRDGGQCTFFSETGHRCPARKLLEYDHVEPVARGGRATVANIRLRCRSHNQYAAERAFGSEFMSEKRRAAEEARARRGGDAEHARAVEEVTPWLRALGLRADESRRAAVAACEELPKAPLEQRVRLAFSYFGKPPQRITAVSPPMTR